MKKYLNCLMLFLLIGSSDGMEVEKVAITEKPLSVLTSDGYEIEIPKILVNELQTLRDMLTDLGAEETDVVIPLANVTKLSLDYLISFYEGTIDLSTLPIVDLSNLLSTADYLDYNDQNRIANSIIDVTEANRNAFLMGKLDLSMITGIALQSQLIQRPTLSCFNP